MYKSFCSIFIADLTTKNIKVKFQRWSKNNSHLGGTFGQNPLGKGSDLKLVEISISHPIKRPIAPIAITRAILDDLWRLSSLNAYMLTPFTKRIKQTWTMYNTSEYLVALVMAMRAVRMATTVWIVLLKASSMVGKYTKVLTTAMKDSQKSMNWNVFQLGQSMIVQELKNLVF